MAPLLRVRTLNHREGEEHVVGYPVSLARASTAEFAVEHRTYFDIATYQCWMRALACNDVDVLNARITALKLTPDYELIRAPESGLMWIQARIGGIDSHLFADNTMLTRVVTRLKSGTPGYNYLLGRNKQYVEQCAMIGVLL